MARNDGTPNLMTISLVGAFGLAVLGFEWARYWAKRRKKRSLEQLLYLNMFRAKNDYLAPRKK